MNQGPSPLPRSSQTLRRWHALWAFMVKYCPKILKRGEKLRKCVASNYLVLKKDYHSLKITTHILPISFYVLHVVCTRYLIYNFSAFFEKQPIVKEMATPNMLPSNQIHLSWLSFEKLWLVFLDMFFWINGNDKVLTARSLIKANMNTNLTLSAFYPYFVKWTRVLPNNFIKKPYNSVFH